VEDAFEALAQRGGCGMVGKILRVDLSRRQWVKEIVDPGLVKMFIGGIGIASKILFEETGPETDPLGSENVVIISPGLLNGTSAPTAYRTEIMTKSPLTGGIGTGNFGGLFGSSLRRAGLEAVILTGKSAGPVYLVIDDDRVELRNAAHLWGKDSWHSTDDLRKEVGEDFSVMAIGQAGENLVKFACPIVDYYHAPGRSHAGCVMGSKNLKAIAVRGTGEIRATFFEKFRDLSVEIAKRIEDFPERGMRQEIGSIYRVADTAKRKIVQARNYQTGIVPDSNELWRPETFKRYLTKGPVFCGQCTLSHLYGCNVDASIGEGEFKGRHMQGISFSGLLWEFAIMCGIESFSAMLKCKEVCNRYGMDQVTPVPFALELFQRGILKKEDLDGVELHWGDADAIMGMFSKIAHREGIGDILAEGSVAASKIIGKGAEQYALPIKGMEIMIGPDPRAGGMVCNLGGMTCIRGGDDLKTTHTVSEQIPAWVKNQGIPEKEYTEWFLNRLDMPDEVKNRVYGDPPNLDSSTYSSDRIAFMVKWYEDLSFVRDSLGVCLFAVNTKSAIGDSYCAKLISAYLGLNISAADVTETGERIANLLKVYNLREGLTRKGDNFPARLFREPLQDGTSQGPMLSKDHIDELLDSYYELRGWNKHTGEPTREKLKSLGLESAAIGLNKGNRDHQVC
jgi:aldehyde:ferredoxin oxidoreductase